MADLSKRLRRKKQFKLGAVVHLGERFLCKEEARGSSPLGSIDSERSKNEEDTSIACVFSSLPKAVKLLGILTKIDRGNEQVTSLLVSSLI